MVIFFPYSKNILQVAILFYLKSQVGFLHFLANSHSHKDSLNKYFFLILLFSIFIVSFN